MPDGDVDDTLDPGDERPRGPGPGPPDTSALARPAGGARRRRSATAFRPAVVRSTLGNQVLFSSSPTAKADGGSHAPL